MERSFGVWEEELNSSLKWFNGGLRVVEGGGG